MNITFDESIKGMRIILSGPKTALDLINLFDKMLVHPEFKVGSNALWDLSNATHPDLSVSDIYKIGAHVKQHDNKRGNGKTAWVVSNDVDFGIARMFEMMTDQDVPFIFRVFNSLDEAEFWIKLGSM